MQSLFLNSTLIGHLHSSAQTLSRGQASFKIKLDGCSSRERISRSQAAFKNEMNAFSSSYVVNCLDQRLTRNRCRKHITKVANSASQADSESKPEALGLISTNNSLKDSFTVVIDFLRLFRAITTVICIISVSFLSVERFADINPKFFIGLLQAIVSASLMDIFIIGINQISDIEIDKINKPDLPLASGKLSAATANMIIAFAVITSTLIGIMAGSKPLLWATFIAFVSGTGYSVDLPLLRWKKSAVAAAICISVFRSLVVPIAYFLHMQTHVLGRPTHFPRSLIFIVAFSLIYIIPIALFKDIPDFDGDKKHGIKSLATRLGKKRVFWICISMFLTAYGGSTLVGLFCSNLLSKAIMVAGNVTFALALWGRAKSTDLASKDALLSIYALIWKLYTAEYFLITLVK